MRSRRGLTLLEVLVAAALLAVGLLGAMEVIARSGATARGLEDRARATMFARSKLEEILKEPVLQTGTDSGQGVDTSTDYDWEANIQPSAHTSLYVVTVAARNRVTGMAVAVSALRRPDIQTAPQTSGTTGTGSSGSAPSAGGPPGGAGPGGTL